MKLGRHCAERSEEAIRTTAPALDCIHALAMGETYEAAVHNAEEALSVSIETLAADGDPIPETSAIDRPVTLGVMVRAETAA